jgi:predicted O-methyltransferase YrrM
MFNHKKYLRKSLRDRRNLPGIDFNIQQQIELLDHFHFNDELLKIPLEPRGNRVEFCFNKGPFPSADAEYLYNIIRAFQPKRILEIGSGHSTLMAINAIKENKELNKNYTCQHICIEPYENKWLEKFEVTVVRDIVQNCNISFFTDLESNDILFIDSSHIIRPQGDVLFEYLEILPILRSGVLIHIHDIFTPEDYPEEWVFYGNNFWNEQYLLEAFLTLNNDFSIIGSTNYLLYNQFEIFSSVHPVTKSFIEKGQKVGAGSLWLKRN